MYSINMNLQERNMALSGQVSDLQEELGNIKDQVGKLEADRAFLQVWSEAFEADWSEAFEADSIVKKLATKSLAEDLDTELPAYIDQLVYDIRRMENMGQPTTYEDYFNAVEILGDTFASYVDCHWKILETIENDIEEVLAIK